MITIFRICLLFLFINVSAKDLSDKIQCDIQKSQKVYLHFNKDFFVTGEEIYFKSYLFNSQNELDTATKILYLDIRNANNQRVLAYRKNLRNGLGSSHFFIPDSLSSGIYKVRAFTNEMRNYSSNRYFTKMILIINQAEEHLNELSIEKQYHTDSSKIITSLVENILSISLPANYTGKHILCYTNSNIIYENSIRELNIKLPLNTIFNGLISIDVYDSIQNILDEKQLLFMPSNKKYHFQTDKLTYKIGDSIHLQFENMEKFTATSISIALKNPAENLKGASLEEYAYSWNSGYNSSMDSTHVFSIKHTQKGGLSAKNIFQNSFCKAIPEKKAHIISGVVKDQDGKLIQRANVLLSVPDSFAQLKVCQTNEKGEFYFLLQKNYDNRNLIIQVKHDSQVKISVELEDKYNDEKPKESEKLVLNDSLANELKSLQVICMLSKILFPIKNITDSVLLNFTNTNFYGETDSKIIPDDFSPLETFEEVIVNIVPGCWYNAKKNTFSLRVMDRGTSTYWSQNALILLNNIPYPDLKYVSSLGTSQIRSIELKKNHLLLGNVFDIFGIVSIKTKQKNTYFLDSEIPSLRFDNSVLPEDPTIAFKSNDKPDLRTCLYWNPNPSLQKEIAIKTSDYEGVYEIKIEGFDQVNQPISVVKEIVIKN